MRKRFPAPMRTSPTWKEEIKGQTFYRRARRERRDKTWEPKSQLTFSAYSAISAVNYPVYRLETFSGR